LTDGFFGLIIFHGTGSTVLGEVAMSLETILVAIPQVSAAVIGDVCLDAYFFLSPDKGEVSVETGLMTQAVRDLRFDLGGAANVALNLRKLGAGIVDLYGLVGDDAYALVFSKLCEEAGVGVDGIVVQPGGWTTQVYHKIYRDGEEQPRLDVGNFNVPREDALERLFSHFEKRLASYDIVVVNEQVVSGIHDPYFSARLRSLMRSQNNVKPMWFGDCRSLNDVYGDLIHKLNRREALAVCSVPGVDKAAYADEQLVTRLFERWGKPVVMTRGENGALAYDGTSLYEVPGLHLINQIDTVGAGDAFLSGLSASMGAGASIGDALIVGNLSAGVAVQKLFQTGHPEPDEILAIGAFPDYRYNPDLSMNLEGRRFLKGTEIEIIARPDRLTPDLVIFDHDGTISTLRLGWERIMESMMLRCIFGEAEPAFSVAAKERVSEAVRGLIARTTGVQTLIQMKALARLVADFGYVPSFEILSPLEYKTIYNRELVAMVEARAERLRQGKLDVGDLTIKGAVPFLERLHKAGMTLCLASGTDQDDVRREAGLLGYAGLFSGGIHGSVGDIDRDPKRVVMEKLLGQADSGRFSLKSDVRCAVFGDGPVELREAKRAGSSAIGLCSDEKIRHGTNLRKRSRLILAGADLLIPDFSWSEELIAFLGWRV